MDDEPLEQVPARTTPTWEMELLVSGATIFGLLQLPRVIDRRYYRAVNLSSEAYAALMMPLWLYAKIAVVTLLLTFLAHLCLRGYWVALVGVNSVYPGGVHWDRLGMGPVARDYLAARDAELAATIERADNRATLVFGIGFSFAMIMLGPVLLVLAAIGLSLVAGAVTGRAYPVEILLTLSVLLVLPWVLASFLDRRFGTRLQGGLRRAVGTTMLRYSRLGFGPRGNPIVALFASRTGRLRFGLIAVAVIVPVSALIFMQAAFTRGQMPLGFITAISGTQVFSPTVSATPFYADLREDPWTLVPLPTIPSRVAEGPYLELFVPFIPRLHGPAMERACPAALLPAADRRPRLQCLSRLIAIQVDGKPVAVELLEGTDPRTGQPGVLAMLPIAGLAPGRHELSLLEPRRRGDAAPAPRRYRIPFWK